MAETKLDLAKKEDEERALLFHNKVIECLSLMRVKTIVLAGCLYEMANKEYFRHFGFESPEQYYASPEINLQVSTAKRYVKIWKKAIVQLKLKTELIKDIPLNNLDLILGAKKPERWLEDAKVLAYGDLRKEFNEKELGIKIPDDDIERHIKKEKGKSTIMHSEKDGCPNWDYKNKSCRLEKF